VIKTVLFTDISAEWLKGFSTPLTQEESDLIGKAGARIIDIEKWLSFEFLGEEKIMLEKGVDSLKNAGTQALLRQIHPANFHIRQGLELILFGLQFSLEELKLHKWINNNQDIVWSYLNGDFETINKANTIKILCEPLAKFAEEYFSICSSIYKETSRFVHGNFESFNTINPKSDVFERIETSCSVIEFYIFVRYYKKLKKINYDILHEIFSETKFHHEEFRQIFEIGMRK